MEYDAQQRQFEAFLKSTTPEDRDYLAFYEFSYALSSAVTCAAMLTPCQDRPEAIREHALLRRWIGDMLFSVLARVELAAIVLNAEGIGFAVRYGIIDACPKALDHIADTEAFEQLAARGYAADAAHACREQQGGVPQCQPCRLAEPRRETVS